MTPGYLRADREFTFLSPMPFDVVARDIPEHEFKVARQACGGTAMIWLALGRALLEWKRRRRK